MKLDMSKEAPSSFRGLIPESTRTSVSKIKPIFRRNVVEIQEVDGQNSGGRNSVNYLQYENESAESKEYLDLFNILFMIIWIVGVSDKSSPANLMVVFWDVFSMFYKAPREQASKQSFLIERQNKRAQTLRVMAALRYI